MMLGVVVGATIAGTFSRIERFNGIELSAIRPLVSQEAALFDAVLDRVRSSYIEAPQGNDLMSSALNGMLTSLDPHSSYLPPKAFSAMQTETRGEFGGLGVEITLENGVVKVVAAIDGTPAQRAGIQANDRIVRIQGDPVMGLTLNQAVERMRGTIGSEVEITIERKDAKPLELKLVRETIKMQTVRARAIDDVGYVRIAQFNEQAEPGLRSAIAKLSREIGDDRVKGFVLDLRNNPGGILEQSVKVAGTFVRGEIVSIKGRDPRDVKKFSSDVEDITRGKPVVVLINGGSASASEIVAGALQDHKRATVIGTRSFGKGSVQSILPISRRGEQVNNGAIRLTTALYFTPNGRSIQARGIQPDREVLIEEIPEELKSRVSIAGESGLSGHIANADGDAKDTSPAYVPVDPEKDTQLTAAVQAIRTGEGLRASE